MRTTETRGKIEIDLQLGIFVFPVRNVGRGVAKVESIGIHFTEIDAGYTEKKYATVPIGEDVWLVGDGRGATGLRDKLFLKPTALHGAMPCVLSVVYTDLNGGQRHRLELGMGITHPARNWQPVRIEHVALRD